MQINYLDPICVEHGFYLIHTCLNVYNLYFSNLLFLKTIFFLKISFSLEVLEFFTHFSLNRIASSSGSVHSSLFALYNRMRCLN